MIRLIRRKVATVLTAIDDDGTPFEIVEIPTRGHWATPRRYKKLLLRYPISAARVTRHNVFELVRPAR